MNQSPDCLEYAKRGVKYVNELPQVTGSGKKRWIRGYWEWVRMHLKTTNADVDLKEIEKAMEIALRDNLNFEKVRRR